MKINEYLKDEANEGLLLTLAFAVFATFGFVLMLVLRA